MSNELDKQISERLHHYESAVDAEAIWDAVKPPRRRRPWFLLLLLFGGISLAGGLCWMINQNHRTNTNTTIVERVTKKATLEEENTSQQKTSAVQEENGQQKNTSSTRSIEKNSFKLQSNTNVDQPGKEHRYSEHDKHVPNTSTKYETAAAYSQKTYIPKTDEPNKTTQHINAHLNEVTMNNTSSAQQKEEIVGLLAPQKVMEKEERHTSDSRVQLLDPIDQPLPSLLGLLPENAPKLNATIKYDDKRTALSSRRSPWSIQTDVAYLMINRELSEADSLNNWINQRLATESVLEALSVDFSINYALHEKWQLRFGLGYTQINTSFTYDNTTTRTDSIEGLKMLIFNIDNTVDSIYGPIGSYETSRRQLEIYNSFRQIELPILINYETRWNSLSLIAETGVRLRLNRSSEGQIIANNGEVVALEDQDWYRTGFGISLQAGLQLGYALNDRIQTRLGGTFRYSPTNFSNENAGFDEAYQLLGVQLGLRYRF